MALRKIEEEERELEESKEPGGENVTDPLTRTALNRMRESKAGR